MQKILLEVHDLKKHFPIYAGVFRKQVGAVKAVDGISFVLPTGSVLGVVGESGCGKSTAARVAMRLLEPTSGHIIFEDKDLLKLNPTEMKNIRKDMQIIFQDPFASLNPRKTIGESIGEGLFYHGMVKSRLEQRERVISILEQIGLSAEVFDRYPHEFSGGQQQRICIGRAIAMNPRMIVCDEALSALDVSVQAQILNLLQELKSSLNLSYLFISHDLSLIRHMSDHILVLYLGKVMESASVDELFRNPKHPYTQALLSAAPKSNPNDKKERIILHGEIPSPVNPPSGCPFRTRCPYAQPICALPPPKKVLRDRITGKEDHIYYCILD